MEVNLRLPDYTVWIEICQKRSRGGVDFPEFGARTCHGDNLAEIREQVGVTADNK
jgi:hypothetical protein